MGDEHFSLGSYEYGVLNASAEGYDSLANGFARWTHLVPSHDKTISFNLARGPDGDPVIGPDVQEPSFFWASGFVSSAAPSAARIVVAGMSSANFFHRLGLLPGASPSQVKSAYHKLALTCHPDTPPDDPHANQRFMDLRQAMEDAQAMAGGSEQPRDLVKLGVDLSTFSPARFSSAAEPFR